MVQSRLILIVICPNTHMMIAPKKKAAKLSGLYRALAWFLTVCSILSLLLMVYFVFVEPFELFFIYFIFLMSFGLYVFGTAAYTGYPPKFIASYS